MKRVGVVLIGMAVFAALSTGAIGQGRAPDIPAPAPDKLELITAFFNNEVATGKLPGAVILGWENLRGTGANEQPRLERSG